MIYIWERSSSKRNIVATLNDNNLGEIIGMIGHVLVSFEGKLIREGTGNNGEVLANLDGNLIREGDNNNGRIIAIINGDEIKQIDLEKQCLYKIEGFASTIEKAALTVAAFMLKGQI
jgi:hypothetical protein